MIRPEAIQLVLHGMPEGPNARTMRIDQINFLGQDCLVRLSGPDFSLLAAMRPQQCAAVAPGDELRIDIAPEDCQLIAADD
jgi:ABC-type Fe3+/spermidine/putrescine transport system ATPase subunit